MEPRPGLSLRKPTSSPDMTETKGNKRDRLFSLGVFAKNKIYTICLYCVLGPQILPETLKAHFACPRISFYLQEKKNN